MKRQVDKQTNLGMSHDLGVALSSCTKYDRQKIKQSINSLAEALAFKVGRGSRVLLKPNLVSAGGSGGLACSAPEFVAGVAEWFLDQGSRVTIGDSPAFGSAAKVMKSCGITAALRGLPVRIQNFRRVIKQNLPSGFNVGLASEALNCDLLVNLPRVKSHCQLMVSLAVKNYFGCVVGWRKPLIHACYGDIGHQFESLLVDLLFVLPGGITFIDGIVAMQGEGPIQGDPYGLDLLGAATNPVALDTALLAVLGLKPDQSPLWRECKRRLLPGVDLADLHFPLAKPAAWQVHNFHFIDPPRPITFHPGRLLVGGCKRIAAGFLGR